MHEKDREPYGENCIWSTWHAACRTNKFWLIHCTLIAQLIHKHIHTIIIFYGIYIVISVLISMHYKCVCVSIYIHILMDIC